jgi:hypothetical protein
MNKYEALGDNYFGFEIFDEVLKVVNERKEANDSFVFQAGVDSAEAAVRRLREEYYDAISKSVMDI